MIIFFFASSFTSFISKKNEKFKYINYTSISSRHQITYDVCNITRLDTASVFFFRKNTMYIVYDTFRLSLDTGLWCTPEFK